MEGIEGLTAGQLKFKILDLERQVEIQKNQNISLEKQFGQKESLYTNKLDDLKNFLSDLEEDCQ